MTIAPRMLAALPLLLVSAGLFAQTPGERPPAFDIKEWRNVEGDKSDKTFKLSEAHGRIVVIYFWRANDHGSIEYLDMLNEIQRLPGTFVIAMAASKEEDVKRVMDGRKKEYSYAWGESIIFVAEDLFDVSHYPRVYLIDPTGVIAWRGHPGELKERIKDQMRRTPPFGADREALNRKLAMAKKLIKQQKLGQAWTYASEVFDVSSEGDLMKSSKDLRKQIREAADDWLEKARKHVEDKEYKEAAPILASLKVRFEGEDVASEAEKEISKLYASRETKKLIREEVDNVRAMILNEGAAELITHKRYVEGLEKYESVVEKYEKTKAAKAAKAEIDKLKGDSTIRKLVGGHRDELQADRWLDIADRFASLEMYPQAREYYKRIVQELPGTTAADRAKDRLRSLPKSKDKT